MSKKNTNVLVGMKCPKCGSLGPFGIAARCAALVTDDGIEETTDFEWDKHDYCSCKSCGYNEDGTSRVMDFYV